jgi:hypothetical protein
MMLQNKGKPRRVFRKNISFRLHHSVFHVLGHGADRFLTRSNLLTSFEAPWTYGRDMGGTIFILLGSFELLPVP